jgi:hypothetical protein
VNARPYNALTQIRPERVPGLGASSQALVVRNGCLTPATITTATATYRWAYSDTTTTAQRGRFGLTVPAGSISSSPGAWLSVTDAVSPNLLTGPTADFHIWGTWTSQSASSVSVSGPVGVLPQGADGSWVDVAVHYAAGGPEFSGPGATTQNADGTISIDVDSLSLVTWVKAPLAFVQAIGQSVFTAREYTGNLLRWYLGLSALQPQCDPDITEDFPTIQTTGSALESVSPLGSASRVPVKFCVEPAPPEIGKPDQATWQIANNVGVAMRLSSPGAAVVGRDGSGDVLSDLYFAGRMDSSSIVLPPGGSALIRVAEGAPTAPVAVTVADRPSIWAGFLARSIGRSLTWIPGDAGEISGNVYSVFNDCLYNLSSFLTGDVATLNVIKCMATLAQTGLPEPTSKVLALASVAVDIIATDVDWLELGLSPRSLDLTYLAPTPASQPTDGNVGGGPVTTPPTGAMLILKRANSTASYLLDSAGVAHHIPDPGTYVCLAGYWPVKYGLDDASFSALATSIGTDASCPPPVGSPRQLTGADSTGFLLRTADGTTYLVNSAGFRVPLFSGQAQFDCMAATHLVWDFVTATELRNIRTDPSQIGTGCSSIPVQGG